MAKTLNLHLPGNLGKAVTVFLIVGALVAVFKILKTVISIHSFKQMLLKDRINNDEVNKHRNLFEKVGVADKVSIINRNRPQAFCFGIFNPRIYLSTGMIELMSQNELEVILRHEKCHLKHRDSLTFILAATIESLFPIFPVFSDLIKIYRTDREINADSVAVGAMSENTSIRDALKKLLQYEPMSNFAFVPQIFSEDSLEARIQSLHSQKTTYKKVSLKNLFLSIISFVILFGIMITPVKAIEIHESGGDAIVLCTDTADNCSMVCRQRALMDMQSHSAQQSSKNYSSVY